MPGELSVRVPPLHYREPARPLLAVPMRGALADVNCDTQAINDGRYYTELMADEPAVWGVFQRLETLR